jgi:hypothetical protein
MKGITEKKLVITEAPQNLICPQGKIYPKNLTAIARTNIVTPLHQTPRFKIKEKFHMPRAI